MGDHGRFSKNEKYFWCVGDKWSKLFLGTTEEFIQNGAEFKLTRRGTILSFSLSDLVIASTGWVVV